MPVDFAGIVLIYGGESVRTFRLIFLTRFDNFCLIARNDGQTPSIQA
jgi:hypothetical protein